MCGVLNAIVEKPSDLASADEIGRTCIHCGMKINVGDVLHRYPDGEAIHKGCYSDLNDEDAHHYEPVGEELTDEEFE